MNCCWLIILLVLCGNCGSNWNNGWRNSCDNDCGNSRKNSCDDDCGNSRRNSCDDDCGNSRRNSYDSDCGKNMSSDSYANNRYSMYNMNNDDCDCHN